jgi:hypothetical protein
MDLLSDDETDEIQGDSTFTAVPPLRDIASDHERLCTLNADITRVETITQRRDAGRLDRTENRGMQTRSSQQHLRTEDRTEGSHTQTRLPSPRQPPPSTKLCKIQSAQSKLYHLFDSGATSLCVTLGIRYDASLIVKRGEKMYCAFLGYLSKPEIALVLSYLGKPTGVDVRELRELTRVNNLDLEVTYNLLRNLKGTPHENEKTKHKLALLERFYEQDNNWNTRRTFYVAPVYIAPMCKSRNSDRLHVDPIVPPANAVILATKATHQAATRSTALRLALVRNRSEGRKRYYTNSQGDRTSSELDERIEVSMHQRWSASPSKRNPPYSDGHTNHDRLHVDSIVPPANAVILATEATHQAAMRSTALRLALVRNRSEGRKRCSQGDRASSSLDERIEASIRLLVNQGDRASSKLIKVIEASFPRLSAQTLPDLSDVKQRFAAAKEGNIIIRSFVDERYRAQAVSILNRASLPECRMSDIILPNGSVSTEVDPSPVYLLDYKTLMPGEWLNGTIINVVMGGIHQEAHGRDTSRGVNVDTYLSTYFYASLQQVGLLKTQRIVQMSKLGKGDRLFTIVNTGFGSHWVAVEMCFSQKTITIMDSFRPTIHDREAKKEYDTMYKSFTTWAETEGRRLIDTRDPVGVTGTVACIRNESPWIFNLCDKCAQQNNGHDCGLFALAAVAARTNGLQPDTVFDGQKQREVLAAWILSLNTNE